MMKDNQSSSLSLQPAEITEIPSASTTSAPGCCLYELVEDIIHRHQSMANQNRARLICNIDPALPARLLLDKQRFLSMLDDLTRSCVNTCRDGQVSLQFMRAANEAHTMSVEISIQSGEDHLGQSYRSLFKTELLSVHNDIQQLGGQVSLPGPDTPFGMSFSLPFETVTDAFAQHNRPDSCIVVLEPERASQSALARILGEITPRLKYAQNLQQLRQTLGEVQNISLLVVGLSGQESADRLLITELQEISPPGQIPVLVLIEPGTKQFLPDGWVKLGKPIRKKGLIRVANKMIRQFLDTRETPRRHVLVVEDNEINLKVISKLLNRHDLSYSIATCGEMAVKLFPESHVDLVLMDIHMPGMDGIEASRQIRALNQQGADVPIIAMTADTLHDTRVQCRSVGINDALIKPLEMEDIQTCLNSWLYPDEEQAVTQTENLDDPVAEMREELHDMLINMLPGYLRQLESFAEQKDLVGLADTAHALAGGASYCGTEQLKHSALALEAIIQSNDPDHYEESLQKLLESISLLLR